MANVAVGDDCRGDVVIDDTDQDDVLIDDSHCGDTATDNSQRGSTVECKFSGEDVNSSSVELGGLNHVQQPGVTEVDAEDAEILSPDKDTEPGLCRIIN